MRLRLEPGIAIVGEAADGPAALELSAIGAPDVVLLDFNLPGRDGLSVCRSLRSRGRAVVVLTIEDGEAVRERCLAAGAAAFVSKQEPMHVLLTAIRATSCSAAS
jgi:DNA-binding NarL/FixJ family response regulator